jgi:hypothetical protein
MRNALWQDTCWLHAYMLSPIPNTCCPPSVVSGAVLLQVLLSGHTLPLRSHMLHSSNLCHSWLTLST